MAHLPAIRLKTLAIALLTVIAGILLGISPWGVRWEEAFGLKLLFKLRGPLPPPDEVVIVSLDEASADHFGLSDDPEDWPRSLHAGLTRRLSDAGAEVIVFDMVFKEPRRPPHDALFAEAIKQAGNVVLCEYLKHDRLSMTKNHSKKNHAKHINIEHSLPPIAPLAEATLASAPFPLPKVPVAISQYWAFKTSAGDLPTLPVVAYAAYAQKQYAAFDRLMGMVRPVDLSSMPSLDRHGGSALNQSIQQVRDYFEIHGNLSEDMLGHLRQTSSEAGELRGLIELFGGEDVRYLNYYGPPGTIKTIPYHLMLSAASDLDLAGKAIFVGLSERFRLEQKDGFYTVFSREGNPHISGVEIAATAFANLHGNDPVRPIKPMQAIIILLVWGFLLGVICMYLAPLRAIVGILTLAAIYLAWTVYAFNLSAVWYPLAITIGFQAPFAYLLSMTGKYIDTNREKRDLQTAFSFYLPENVVEDISRNVNRMDARGHLAYGTCLISDAAQYTTLSEQMDPGPLRQLMNRYYESIFEPIRRNGGIISDVVGDSVMAIWTTGSDDGRLQDKACNAALEVVQAVKAFGNASRGAGLPVRIGIHSGELLLGNVGALDHYEYRAVGDVVNTTARMEGLNKFLGTTILVSSEVLDHTDEYAVRALGRFLLAGKTKPIEVFELLQRDNPPSPGNQQLKGVFQKALNHFRERRWEAAEQSFSACLALRPGDGPSVFYIDQCRKLRYQAPQIHWDGVVIVGKK